MTFYYFLNDLFQITLDLDGSINKLNTHTVGLEYCMWCWWQSPYRKGGDKTVDLMESVTALLNND